MPLFTRPPTWTEREPISAAKLNAMTQGVVRQINVGPGLKKTTSPDGSQVAIALGELPRTTGKSDILVKITGAATGAGKYNGRSVISPYGADVDATTALTSADLGTFAAADDCLVLNMTEIGTSSHNLTNVANTNQFYFFGRLLKTNSDGKKVVAINGFWAKSCV